MNRRSVWTPQKIRALNNLAASGPGAISILGESTDGLASAYFQQPIDATRFGDPEVAKLFALRAVAPGDPRFMLAAREAGLDASTLFSPSPDALHVSSYMANVLEYYRNNAMVAQRVAPVVKVNERNDLIARVPMGTGMSPVDVRLAGQSSNVHELNWNVGQRASYIVADYGLMTFIPTDTSNRPFPPFEVRRRSAVILADTLELMQEIDVAGTLSTTGNYAAGYVTTIAASADKWDQPTSDPAKTVRAAVAKLLRPNGTRVVAVMGYDVFLALQYHPKMLAAIYGRSSTMEGATSLNVTEKMIAAVFRVDEVIVGTAKKNTANDGQTVTLADVWSGFCALVVVQEQPDAQSPAGFAFQFRYNNVAMDTQYIPWLLSGVRGGEYCKVTHSTAVVLAGQFNGYLIATVLT